MAWGNPVTMVRLNIARRPLVFALVAVFAAALILQGGKAPLNHRDEALAAQISSSQTLYNQIMANTNRLDQAAIDLRRMATQDNDAPYARYFAALNDLRWNVTPAQTPFLDEPARAQALAQIASLGEAGEDYVRAVRDLRQAYQGVDVRQTVVAADAAEVSYRALRDRVLTLKSSLSAGHTAALAVSEKDAEHARAREDLIFNGLLLCCLGFLAFFVAARKRAVVLLAKSRKERETLDAVVNSALHGVMMVDESGRIELFSPAAGRILECEETEALGAPVARFFDPAAARRHRWLFDTAARRRRSKPIAFQRVVEARRHGGEIFPMHLAVSETSIGGQRKFVVIISDITNQLNQSKQLEVALRDAQAASRAKTDFLTAMSHELRTPLNGVLGMASALAAGPLPVSQREMVHTILSSGRHLLGLLNDILDLAAVDAGEIALTPQVFDVETLLTEQLGPYADRASDKGLELSVNVEPAALGAAFADPGRIGQLLGNLVSNAIKFTEKGEIVVDVQRPGDSTLRFTIRDTGVGFDMATKARLFADFEQGDLSLTRRYGGTGLGLTISRHLVRLMGGEIGCDSRVGEGSTFWFEIAAPVAAKADAKPLPSSSHPLPASVTDLAAPVAETSSDDQPLKILCVDDNCVNRRVIGVLLAPLGAEVTFAEDGAQAVQEHAKGDFDIILMDLQMPVMDGLTATRAIRAAEAKAHRRRARIIAVTANSLPEQVRECRAAGMDAHVGKPVLTDILYAAMTPSESDFNQIAVA